MSFQRTKHFEIFGNPGEYCMAERPWWLNIIYEFIYLAYALLITAIGVTVALETNGVLPIAGTAVFAMFSLLIIFRVEVNYFRVGEWIEIDMGQQRTSPQQVDIEVKDTPDQESENR